MSGEFKGARLKVGRSHKHINEVRRLVDEFVGANKNSIVTKRNEGTSELIYEFSGIVPDSINLAFGDATHNLRAAFDHCIFALVRMLNPGARAKSIQLAIHPERNGTESAMKDTKTPIGIAFNTPLGERVRSVILKTIYEGTAGNNPFLLLHGLDNIDKHRLLVTVGQVGGGYFEETHLPGNVTIRGIALMGKQNPGNPARLVKFPAGKVSGYPKPILEVCINETEFPGHQPLVKTLDDLKHVISEMIDAVERCVTTHGAPP